MSSPADPEPSTPAPRADPAPPVPAGPRPLVKPPRGAMTMRDILVAIGVLLVVVLAVAGVSGSCSFAPAGPTVDTTRLPVVDAPAELRTLARTVPFELRVPAVPPGWRSNSVDQDRAADGAGRVVRTGYLTSDGRYLRLLQSDASEAALLAVETGPRPVPGLGAVDVGGARWVAYGAPDDEPIWISEGTGARLLITGSGTDAEFRALAGAVAAGEKLPVG